MRTATTVSLVLICTLAYSQGDYSVSELKEGTFKEDSSYVYSLPFENKKLVFVVQGYETKLSHRGERALDFKVKKGTKICAARDGVVIAMREDSRKGGLRTKNLADGNYVTIRHSDNSVAHYWHLKRNGAMVEVGDTVKTGDFIGLSGNTGYSAFPHLHFEVQGYDTNGRYRQLATRFKIGSGIRYLRSGRFYRVRR